MTDDELKTWAALAEKATAGPWTAESLVHNERQTEWWISVPAKTPHVFLDSTATANDPVFEWTHNDLYSAQAEHDVKFMAAMSIAVPALIAEVRRLRGAHEALRKAADAFVYVGDISGPGTQSIYNEALMTLLPLLRPTP